MNPTDEPLPTTADFSGDTRVVLSDGKSYGLPTPEARPSFGPDGPNLLNWYVSGRPADRLGAEMEALAMAGPDGTGREAIKAWYRKVGIVLLRHNYVMSPEQAEALTDRKRFPWWRGRAKHTAMLNAFADSATGFMGQVKKARAALPPVKPSGSGPLVGLN